MSSVTASNAIQPSSSSIEALNLINDLNNNAILNNSAVSPIQEVPYFTTQLDDPVLQEASYIYNPSPEEQLSLQGVYEIYNDISDSNGIASPAGGDPISVEAAAAAYINTPATQAVSQADLQHELELVGLPSTLQPLSNPQDSFNAIQNFIDTLNTQAVPNNNAVAAIASDEEVLNDAARVANAQQVAQELAIEVQNLPEGTLIDLVA